MDELRKNRAISDLYLISALIAYGLRPLRIDRSIPRRQKFLFDAEVKTAVVVSDNDSVVTRPLTVDEIETYFLADALYFPGSYPKALRDIRLNVRGYREDADDY